MMCCFNWIDRKMLIIFCVAFVFPIRRYTGHHSFVTKSVRVGEDVTLTCSRRSSLSGYLSWIRIVAGNFPEILASTYTFDNASVFQTHRFTAKQGPGTFVLHITKAELSDAAFYCCQQALELHTLFLNKTFLRVKGPEPDITAVIQERRSAPARPGDSVTLQCSVLSASERRTCPGEPSVFWFRAGSDESHPSVMYVHGNGAGCEKSHEAHSPQKCVYSFSKDVTSSDVGTHYCAVATCGQILFGNGTKLDIEAAVLQTNAATTTTDDQQADEDSLVYSVTNFTRRKAGRSLRRAEVEEESIYSGVRVLG
ncbi:uncharacterized protein LOC117737684 isoform X3 [Cyclopterus lumpus]|uniref:uncharacterized protein LOC117737684 isoform X3 n=1 Tax=Cyclopterus lumpus TaxID=8103 RepID=UPI0014870F61|nr:uncharacterized protein LOC117737684 isoform X3 [Cyclopterus lumpus]